MKFDFQFNWNYIKEHGLFSNEAITPSIVNNLFTSTVIYRFMTEKWTS